MKWILLSVWLSACASAFALDEEQVNKLVGAAADAPTDRYIEARNAVLALGTNALPFLCKSATDAGSTWREHLAARICYERLVRAEDIEALRRHDWKQYPPYEPGKPPRFELVPKVVTNENGQVRTEMQTVTVRPGKIYNILGRYVEMDKYVIGKCREMGLWYYYLETYWKKTEEGPIPSFDRRFDSAWPRWCIVPMEEEPEQYYRIRILLEWLEEDKEMSGGYAKEFYRYLLHKKIPDAVPVLVQRYEDYFKREASGMEVYPGARNESLRGLFEPILLFADSRHADLIENYIAEHPALAPLKEKVAEVRARPAPPPTPEPPFRLGTKLVILK